MIDTIKNNIEINGDSHSGQEKYNKIRQERLEGFGVKFLRFENELVYYNLKQVLKTNEKWIEENND
jgi:very-short-patch-repair endonuclease